MERESVYTSDTYSTREIMLRTLSSDGKSVKYTLTIASGTYNVDHQCSQRLHQYCDGGIREEVIIIYKTTMNATLYTYMQPNDYISLA